MKKYCILLLLLLSPLAHSATWNNWTLYHKSQYSSLSDAQAAAQLEAETNGWTTATTYVWRFNVIDNSSYWGITQTSSDFEGCPAGEQWNGAMDQCESVCTSPDVWNEATQQCESPQPEPPPDGCPANAPYWDGSDCSFLQPLDVPQNDIAEECELVSTPVNTYWDCSDTPPPADVEVEVSEESNEVEEVVETTPDGDVTVRTEKNTTENPDGSVTETTVTTTTDPNGQVTTIIKEITKDAGGQVVDQTVSGSVSQGPQPGSSSLTGGLNCKVPPVCSGDAVQCGIVQQNWRNRCRIGWASDVIGAGCSTEFKCIGDPIECARNKFLHDQECVAKDLESEFELGWQDVEGLAQAEGPGTDENGMLTGIDKGTIDVVGAMNVDGVFTQTSSYSSTCPSPYVLALSGGEFELSYQPICDVATRIAPLVVLLFSFMSAMIVYRGLQGV